jgi:predicted nucleotidyltransferase
VRKLDLAELGRFLSTRREVVFAVAFGSAQDGHVRPGSDLDLGIYFDPRPSPEALAALLVAVADLLAFDDIDCTDLAAADPILAFEAISGRFLCRNSPERTAEVCSLICREYEDAMALLNRAA